MKRILWIVMAGLASAARGAPPEGYIVRVDSATLYLDWGEPTGVRPGDPFTIFRPGESLTHPKTGKVLGAVEDRIGDGFVEAVKPEYSIGKILSAREAPRRGDRVRHPGAAAPRHAAAAATIPGAAVIASSPTLIWISAPLNAEARGIAAGDFSGDARPDLIFLTADGPELWTSAEDQSGFERAERYRGKGRNWLAVDVGPADPAGGAAPLLAASFFSEFSRRAVSAIMTVGEKRIEERFTADGFLRLQHAADGRAHFVRQDVAVATDFRFSPPEAAVCAMQECRIDAAVRVAPEDLSPQQLFGFAWADWDGDGRAEPAVLKLNRALTISFPSGPWTSEESYGRTLAALNFQTMRDVGKMEDETAQVSPRLAVIAGQPPTLVLYRNNARLGVNLGNVGSFTNFALFGLQWNGQSMEPAWKIEGERYLADFAVFEGPGKRIRLALAIREKKRSRLKVYEIR